jgi:predicted dehydrogenase
MITSGALGDIVAGNMIFSSPAGLMQPADSWRMNPERCIALVVSQLGVHLVDTFNYLFGLPVEVQATVRSVALSNGVEDLCSGTLEYEGGTCANFTVCYSTARRRVLEVLGTKGSVYADESNIWYRSIESSSAPEVTTFPDYDTVREEFEEFVRCCLTAAKPETDGLAGLRAVAVMEKVLSANLERKALKFDWNSLETRDTGPPQAQGNGAVPFRET